MKKLVYGIGINDSDYMVRPRNGSERIYCPFYSTWKEMLRRVSRPKKFPMYSDVSVCNEWLIFSNFKRWMEDQEWEGKSLDKDILGSDKKIYSPETCCFVDKVTNSFFSGHKGKKSKYPQGVDLLPSGKYSAKCRNPFTKKKEYLGSFTSVSEASNKWLIRKREIAEELSKMQSDKRVSLVLMELFSLDFIGELNGNIQ